MKFVNSFSLPISMQVEFFALIMVFRVALDYSYQNVISQIYEYMGFYNHASIASMAISYFVLFIMSIPASYFFINKHRKLSNLFIYMLFLISFVPFTSMLGFGIFSKDYIICNIFYWFFLFIFVASRFSIFPKTNIYPITTSNISGKYNIIICTILLGFIVLYISGKYVNFRLNFDLLSVYNLREEASSIALPSIIKYAFSWSRVILPVLIAYFIIQRMYIWTVCCVIIQLFSFGFDGSKSSFFLMILAAVFGFMPRLKLRHISRWILRGIVAVTIGCLALYCISGNFVPLSMLIRRVFFIPAEINFYYFDFFSTHQPDYFRQSFLRHLAISSPYNNIPNLIGDIYFNNISTNANNGLLADAMANLGYVGIIIFPLIISIILNLLDKSSKDLDPRIYVTVALYMSIVLTNTFLFTVLVTHGLLITILLLSLMKKKKKKTEMQNERNTLCKQHI